MDHRTAAHGLTQMNQFLYLLLWMNLFLPQRHWCQVYFLFACIVLPKGVKDSFFHLSFRPNTMLLRQYMDMCTNVTTALQIASREECGSPYLFKTVLYTTSEAFPRRY